jgi:hypothetical protein
MKNAIGAGVIKSIAAKKIEDAPFAQTAKDGAPRTSTTLDRRQMQLRARDKGPATRPLGGHRVLDDENGTESIVPPGLVLLSITRFPAFRFAPCRAKYNRASGA